MINKPDQPDYLRESKKLEFEIAQDQFRSDVLASIPEDEPNKEKVVAALKDALALDPNTTVQGLYQQTTRQVALQHNLSKRDFFTDPLKTKAYGSDTLRRARDLIRDFTKSKLDQK